ncbi:Thiol peroxidase [Cedecea davisae]|nr:Thiol peroxidase [Cedecea davisae]
MSQTVHFQGNPVKVAGQLPQAGRQQSSSVLFGR